MLLAGLSTGNKVGLALVAALFIVFALVSSFLVPRYRPDYPGRSGLPVFVLATVALFVGMMAAVLVFGRESEGEASAGGKPTESVETTPSTTPATTNAGAPAQTISVKEKEFKIELGQKQFSPGSYEIDLKNVGKIPHNLAVKGPGVSNAATPVIGPGKTAKLRVALTSGQYELYCAVPGHKEAGMDLKIKVT